MPLVIFHQLIQSEFLDPVGNLPECDPEFLSATRLIPFVALQDRKNFLALDLLDPRKRFSSPCAVSCAAQKCGQQV